MGYTEFQCLLSSKTSKISNEILKGFPVSRKIISFSINLRHISKLIEGF